MTLKANWLSNVTLVTTGTRLVPTSLNRLNATISPRKVTNEKRFGSATVRTENDWSRMLFGRMKPSIPPFVAAVWMAFRSVSPLANALVIRSSAPIAPAATCAR